MGKIEKARSSERDNRTSDGVGIQAGGAVRLEAGRDAVGRDKLKLTTNNFNILSWFNRSETTHSKKRIKQLKVQIDIFRKRLESVYNDRLEDALGPNTVRVELGLETAVGATPQILEGYLPLPATVRESARAANLADLWTESSKFNPRLLVIGDPGMGKTTMLIELAATVIGQSTMPNDEIDPLPIILPLARWVGSGRRHQRRLRLLWWRRRAQRDEFRNWIASEIATIYRISLELAEFLISENAITLLFDGLDEIPSVHRRAECVASINQFLAESNSSVVVTCRPNEYDELPTKLALDSAISIAPLEAAAVMTSISAEGKRLEGVQRACQADPELLELCRSPLLLSMAVLAYHDLPEQDVGYEGSQSERRHKLIADYVARRLSGLHSAKEVRYRHWLQQLARSLEDHQQSVLLLEKANPSWLSRTGRAGATMTLLLSIMALTFVALRLIGSVPGTFSWIAVALVGFGSVISFGDKVWPSRAYSWSFNRIGLSDLIVDSVFFTAGGVIYALTKGSSISAVTPIFGISLPGWLAGAVGGAIVGVVIGTFFGGWGAADVASRSDPYEILRRSVRDSLILGLVAAICCFVVGMAIVKILGTDSYLRPIGWEFSGLPAYASALLKMGFVLGVMVCASSGLLVAFGHVCWRCAAALTDFAPVRYVNWLEEMVQRRILYRSGGGYVFIHGLAQRSLSEF